jgi:hypothetical protein
MRAVRGVVLLLGLCASVAPRLAEAGRRPFIWGLDTETVPQGDVELEQWLWARTQSPDLKADRPAVYWIWWGPVVGVSNHLEVAAPFQVSATGAGPTALESFELDVRYRIFSRTEQEGFQPLLRAAWHQAIQTKNPSRLDANAVLSYGPPDALHAVVDLGVRLGVASDMSALGTYDAGLSYAFFEGELKVALELFGEVGLSNDATQHHFVGLNVSWTRGRFWVTAGTLVGLTAISENTPSFMPRLIWAIAL